MNWWTPPPTALPAGNSYPPWGPVWLLHLHHIVLEPGDLCSAKVSHAFSPNQRKQWHLRGSPLLFPLHRAAIWDWSWPLSYWRRGLRKSTNEIPGMVPCYSMSELAPQLTRAPLASGVPFTHSAKTTHVKMSFSSTWTKLWLLCSDPPCTHLSEMVKSHGCSESVSFSTKRGWQCAWAYCGEEMRWCLWSSGWVLVCSELATVRDFLLPSCCFSPSFSLLIRNRRAHAARITEETLLFLTRTFA